MIYTYLCKDRRVRGYDPITKKVISYPRILMAEKLGRPLEPHEQVHHLDNDTTNNNINNLELVNIGEHQSMHSRKYQDTIINCGWCNKEFLWTAKQQRTFNGNISRKNNKCTGSYGKKEQMISNDHTECE